MWSNSKTSKAGMLAGAGEGSPTIHMGPVYVTEKVDVEALAYRVATINARGGSHPIRLRVTDGTKNRRRPLGSTTTRRVRLHVLPAWAVG